MISIAGLRVALDEYEPVQKLIHLGSQGGEVALARFAQGNLKNADEALAAYAYVIEKTKYVPAKKELEHFMLSSPGRKGYTSSPDFVVRALLVLKGLRDDTRGYR